MDDKVDNLATTLQGLTLGDDVKQIIDLQIAGIRAQIEGFTGRSVFSERHRTALAGNEAAVNRSESELQLVLDRRQPRL